jgi:sulfate permease, SulP family
LILCGAREQPARLIHKAEFEQHVGAENICSSVEEALARARSLYPRMASSSRMPATVFQG